MAKNENFENFVLTLVVGGLILAGTLYVGFLFWPYIIFYILPFVLGSVFVGWILLVMTKYDEPQKGKKGLETLRSGHRYRRLLIFYPCLVVGMLVTFHLGSERVIGVDKDGKPVSRYVEWPKMNNTYNDWRSSTYDRAPFEALNKKAREVQIYDRKEMGWIFWLALFLGGPALYLYWSIGTEGEDQKWISREVRRQTEYEQKRLSIGQQDLEATISQRTQRLEEKVAEVLRERNQTLAENRILQAKLEFSAKGPKAPSGGDSEGLLDKDIL